MNVKPVFYSYSKKNSKLSKAERKKAAISEAKWVLKKTDNIKGVNSKQREASFKSLSKSELEQLSRAIKVMERSIRLQQKKKVEIKRAGNESYIAKMKPCKVRMSASKHIKNDCYSLADFNYYCCNANVTRNFGPIKPEPPRRVGAKVIVRKK